jgi:hypothetical protein
VIGSREERPTHMESHQQATISNNNSIEHRIDVASSHQTTICRWLPQTERLQQKFKTQSTNATIKLKQRL